MTRFPCMRVTTGGGPTLEFPITILRTDGDRSLVTVHHPDGYYNKWIETHYVITEDWHNANTPEFQ